MNYIVIGLGSFGSAIAINLTESGHEVMAVDKDISRVEALKERVSHAVALDATVANVLEELPLKATDMVIVAIGEEISANIITTALLKLNKVNKLACRAISTIHQTILEAMHVDIVINPEDEAADKWAKKLAMKGVEDSHCLAGPYYVIEVDVPPGMIDNTLEKLRLKEEYKVLVLTTFTHRKSVNPLGATIDDVIINKIATKETVLNEGDVMVVYGNIKDIKKMLSDF